MRDDSAVSDEGQHTADTPERQLIAGVLSQAVSDATCPSKGDSVGLCGVKVSSARTSAERWIDSDSERPLGFRWCCAVVGLDPEVVRERIQSRGPCAYRALKWTRHTGRATGR